MVFLWANVALSQTAETSSSDVSYEMLKKQLGFSMDYSSKNAVLNSTVNSFQSTTHAYFQKQDTGPIPKAYQYDDLAFFCKIEVQVEQKIKIPIKFRLGEFNQIERLEGKPFNPFLIR